ncbi:MAG: cob(I)yrinic acid a,c-diamide adenosyltransferase [Desulfurococcales archaeon]|jgi:cob(I)alamin adenosyltransferase|nr:cob(I)yrinic acid a,c-diamide adenosyltransferase [Desulfurococcales archaeon]
MKKVHGGDDGYTYIMHGVRVAKEDDVIELLGSVDELNTIIGVARSLKPPEDVDKILKKLQEILFRLGSDVATPLAKLTAPKIGEEDLRWVEDKTRGFWEMLPEPRLVFVYPSGDPAASMLHLARTVCRRAERVASKLYHSNRLLKSHLVLLNRISDLLFVLARYVNHVRGVKEELWP